MKPRSALPLDGPPLDGLPIHESWLIPRDEVAVITDPTTKRRTYTVHPATMMRLRCNGRMPLWTRYSRGVVEAERDRRRFTV